MYRYYFIFHSVTSAQRALHLLRGKGIEAVLAPAPGMHLTNGCGHAIQVKSPWKKPASAVLRADGLIPLRVLRAISDGTFEEVPF